ncbi:hypothetical protein [Aeromicrobium sp. 179-A 4D2 NHS]|uniref:hypothetical protein n=1 Tax=Aeromicrobium sp. 179-A 4D2 NHS TaxID=3142375 RepID=UPI0039A2E1DA
MTEQDTKDKIVERMGDLADDAGERVKRVEAEMGAASTEEVPRIDRVADLAGRVAYERARQHTLVMFHSYVLSQTVADAYVWTVKEVANCGAGGTSSANPAHNLIADRSQHGSSKALEEISSLLNGMRAL